MDLNIKRGINLDGKPWTIGSGLAQKKYFHTIKEAGFDHIRLPVTIIHGDPEIGDDLKHYKVIRELNEMALEEGLIPFVDVHPFAGMNEQPQKYRGDFIRFWEEFADYLKDMDERVIFEVMNEPDNDYNFRLLNEVQNEAIAAIRKSNPTRMIAAASAHCNTIENLEHLILPDDENIFVTIHEYTPMSFTHQGADWCEDGWPIGTTWGTEAEKEILRERFEMAKEWGDKNKRFIHLGEFGPIKNANIKDRCEWTRYIIKLCEECGFAWAYWEFAFCFGIYDLETEQWNKPLLDALMG